jgi:uncharacterized protein
MLEKLMNKKTIFQNVNKAIKSAKFGKVVELLTPLAELGDSEAQFLLGYLYFIGADVSYLESISWLIKSADQGNAKASYYLAINVDDPNCLGIKDRKKYLEKSALLGYSNAQRDIGCAFATGQKGFKKNERKAQEWYRKAAEQGHPDAQFNLGLMLLNGEGSSKKLQEGIAWLKTSAEKGRTKVVEAAKLLHEIYDLGLFGIPENKKVSKYWKEVHRKLDKKGKKE